MVHRGPIAVCDACVLYPFHLRNLLVQASMDGLYSARWSDEIHEEWIRNLLANVKTIPLERLRETQRLMERALPDAKISGFERHIESVQLPDSKDRHVVAAAIEAKATHILTWNLRDFPMMELKKYGLIRQTPDAFLSHIYDKTPALMVASLSNARRNLSKSGTSSSDFLDALRAQRLTQLEKRLRKHAVTL
jgi:predicted nucleic acid-binding protein